MKNDTKRRVNLFIAINYIQNPIFSQVNQKILMGLPASKLTENFLQAGKSMLKSLFSLNCLVY